MESDNIFSNRDWDPEYLKLLFSEDFYDMNYHWMGTSYVSDEDLVKVTEKYCPITEDISLDDDTLPVEVERIESQNQVERSV